MKHRLGSAVVAATCALGACSPSTDGPGTCTGQTPAAPAATGNVVRDEAIATEFATIDRFLGRYLRGDVPTYAGAAYVEETAGLTSDKPLPISTAQAVAALALEGDTATLTVADPVIIDGSSSPRRRVTR